MASEGCSTSTTTTTPATTYCSNGGSNAGSLPGSLGRDYRSKQSNLSSETHSDDELDDSKSTRTHTLERHKSDRNISNSSNKPEEDRRRRTIIIEKKNASYGFTLQTYGIHYRKEQEIEMITYVDYVEYDGPAYKAGMREGDVILSINGIDMEKADHKTLVDLIKKCDTRMRMVVLFEDCVRKVALHMRYIHLQNNLQDKINELERACLQERQLLTGKWKTHSLPARKKTSNSVGYCNGTILNNNSNGGITTNGDCQPTIIYRPAISTEDVVNVGGHSRYAQQQHQQQQHQQLQHQQQQQQVIIPPPDQFIVAYQYLDPNYRYVLKPSTSNSSGEYFISVGPQRSPSECHYILTRDGSTEMIQRAVPAIPQLPTVTSSSHQAAAVAVAAPLPSCCDHDYAADEQQQRSTASGLPQKMEARSSRKSSVTGLPPNQKSYCHGHSCNPCMGNFGRKSSDKNNTEDNTSLDAYDLASSPCCAAHCVPTRRRSRNSKEHHHHHKHKHRDKESNKDRQRPRSQSHASPEATHHHHHHHHHNNGGQQSSSSQPQQQQQPQAQQQQQQPPQQPQQQPPHKHQSNSIHSRSKYFNLSANLASHCSLHSCTSSEFVPAESSASYTTSLSTDTLYWDPQSEGNSRQPSTKSRQSYHPTGSVTTLTSAGTSKGQQLAQKGFNSQQQQATSIYQQQQQQQQQQHQRYCMHPSSQMQPASVHQIYQTPVCASKPKSWDNLTTKAFGGYGFGYGYLDTIGPKPTTMKAHHPSDTGNNAVVSGQHRHSIPRKNPYGRYSTYTDVENYAPPPSQFVEEISTLTVFVKKTEQMVTEKSLPSATKPQLQPQQPTTSVTSGSGGTIITTTATPKLLKNNSNNNLTNLTNQTGK